MRITDEKIAAFFVIGIGLALFFASNFFAKVNTQIYRLITEDEKRLRAINLTSVFFSRIISLTFILIGLWVLLRKVLF